MVGLRLFRLDASIALHVWRNRYDPNLQQLLENTYVGRWPFCLFAGSFSKGLRRLFSRPPYPSKDCQPKFFCSFLSNRPVWPSTCNVSKLFLTNFEQIKKEFHAFEGALGDDINTNALTVKGKWEKVHLISHSFKHEVLENFPTTRRVLESIPFCTALGSAYFSTMEPGTTVRPHFGPTNFRIRYHLGIDVSPEDGAWLQVADGMYRWHQGHTLVFQDAYMHAVRIDENIPTRVVLIVDIYHPDLTTREQKFLEEIQDIHESIFPTSSRNAH